MSASHIAECSACGEFVAELKADQALLRSSTELPEFAHAAVRGRVLGKVGRTRRYGWVAAAIAAAVLIAMFVPRTIQVAPVVLVPQAPKFAAVEPVSSAPSMPTRVEQARVRKRPAVSKDTSGAELIAALDALYEERLFAAPGAPGQTVITMETADPNVTILLLGETTGDDE